LVINPTGASLSKGNGTFVYLSNKAIQFTNISPGVKDSVTVNLNVTTTNATCSASTVQWFAHAWTGSPSNPSQTFTLTPLPQNTTINAGSCTLGFIAQPTSATVDTNITSVPYNTGGAAVKVGLFSGNTLDTTFAGPLSIAIKPNTGTTGAVLTAGAATFAGGVATFPSLSINTVGPNYKLTATSGSRTVDSNAFWITAVNGTLGCDESNNYASSGGLDPNDEVPASLDPGWGLRRGPNWDGPTPPCVLVGYIVTLDQTNNILSLIWDKTTGQKAAFKYVVVWPKVKVDGGATAGWTQKRPNVSWGTTNTPVAGTNDYVPALACVGDDLTFGQNLLPIIPNVPPFDAASNPQAQYLYDGTNTAKMCVAQQGFASDGKVGTDIYVIYWDKIVDEADGWVGLP
jgi:hypothetical protein